MQDRSGKGASFDAVRNLIGHPGDLEYTDVLKSSFHCLDVRINKPVLGFSPFVNSFKFIRNSWRRHGRVYLRASDL